MDPRTPCLCASQCWSKLFKKKLISCGRSYVLAVEFNNNQINQHQILPYNMIKIIVFVLQKNLEREEWKMVNKVCKFIANINDILVVTF